MIVTLEEVKNYIRVDSDYEDELILTFSITAQSLCENILRFQLDDAEDVSETVRIAVLYGTSYLYENRENADFKELTVTLKCLLFAEREDVF